MYRIVIADDEWLIREGLKQTVDWANIGCSIVAEAANGEEALQVVLEHKPDILITDIRMPGMDGLSLVAQARSLLPHLMVIFLTGFDDFSYAQQAIKLQASDFVLKPTNPDELIKVVARVCEQIGKSRDHAATLQNLHEQLEQGQVLIMQKLLHDQMLGIADDASCIMLEELLRGCHLEKEGFRVVLTEVDARLLDNPPGMSLWHKVVGLMESRSLNRAIQFDESRIAFIMLNGSGDIIPHLRQTAAAYAGNLELTFGVSLPYHKQEHMRTAFREASVALRNKRPGAEQTISEFGDILQWTGQAALPNADNFRQIEAYIQSRYAEDISLSKLAALLHMSEAHFSRLFRKRVGTSFIDYVTQIRMEQAKQLLGLPDARINEVSVSVGYQDARYFSQIFRKYTGKTPTEFRNGRGYN
ncbi:response regulator [Paenibacillus sp. HWE-109]|uniref:response regulator n=1 Tax=Paenibacillus sp. HWE-109 TaxID=1306526 RepID=UPI001EE07B50|nr:response regulator [Paenibacillus sp. HWE-109]UKS30887.1 response regulator [Paenibacillus sp. HWE-109]